MRFQSDGLSRVGGVYRVAITDSIAYRTDAGLSALSANNGVVSPELADGVLEYRLTVPFDADSVAIDAPPSVPNGLVYFDGVLVDDATPRTVALEDGEVPTVVDIRAYAQDHTTSLAYRVEITHSIARFDIHSLRWTPFGIRVVGSAPHRLLITIIRERPQPTG